MRTPPASFVAPVVAALGQSDDDRRVKIKPGDKLAVLFPDCWNTAKFEVQSKDGTWKPLKNKNALVAGQFVRPVLENSGSVQNAPAPKSTTAPRDQFTPAPNTIIGVMDASKQRLSTDDILVMITSWSETGNASFDRVNTTSKTDGIAAGILQWQAISGDLEQLLLDFKTEHPADFKRLFGDRSIAVENVNRGSVTRPIYEAKMTYKGILVKDLGPQKHLRKEIGPYVGEIGEILREAGRDLSYQTFQMKQARARLDKSLSMKIDSWQNAPTVGSVLKTYLGHSMIFDLQVHHGSGKADQIVEAAARRLANRKDLPKDQPITEDLFIAAICEERNRQFPQAGDIRSDKILAVFQEKASGHGKAQAQRVKNLMAELRKLERA